MLVELAVAGGAMLIVAGGVGLLSWIGSPSWGAARPERRRGRGASPQVPVARARVR